MVRKHFFQYFILLFLSFYGFGDVFKDESEGQEDLSKINILQCAHEGPIAKLGGVGSVAIDLSKMINKLANNRKNERSQELLGIFDGECANIMPYYPKIMDGSNPDFKSVCIMTHCVLGVTVYTEILYDEKRSSFYCKFLSAVEVPKEYKNGRKAPFTPKDLQNSFDCIKKGEDIYTTGSNPFDFLIRMHYFASAVSEFARDSWKLKAWKEKTKGIKVLHLHSWGCALIATNIKNHDNLNRIKTIYTMHNFNHDLGFSWIYHEKQGHDYNGVFLNHLFDMNGNNLPFFLDSVSDDGYLGFLKKFYKRSLDKIYVNQDCSNQLFQRQESLGNFWFHDFLPITLLGLIDSDYITVVSESLFKDIASRSFDESWNIGPLMRYWALTKKAFAIPNSIEYEKFDPSDKRLLGKFSIDRSMNDQEIRAKKHEAKKELQRLGFIKDANKPLFVYIGRMEPEKGVEFLKKFHDACNHENRGQLIIMGPFSEDKRKDLDHMAHEMGLHHHAPINSYQCNGAEKACYIAHNDTTYMHLGIEFQHQKIEDIELKTLIRFASDYNIIPSRDESFGIVALESLSLLTPIITSYVQGLKDICTSHRNAKDGYFDTLTYYLDRTSHEATEYEINMVMNAAFDCYSQKKISPKKILSRSKENPLFDWLNKGGAIEKLLGIYKNDTDKEEYETLKQFVNAQNLKTNDDILNVQKIQEKMKAPTEVMDKLEKNLLDPKPNDLNTIYHGEDVSAQWLYFGKKTLFIVLATADLKKSDEVEFWKSLNRCNINRNFFEKKQWDCIFIGNHGNHWYQSSEMNQLIWRINHIIQKKYNRVITYGGSMGGFGSIAFSGLIDKITDVIAFCPQIEPSEYCLYNAWKKEWNFHHLWPTLGAFSKNINYFCFYGNGEEHDKRACELLLKNVGLPIRDQRENVFLYSVPYSGHTVMMPLLSVRALGKIPEYVLSNQKEGIHNLLKEGSAGWNEIESYSKDEEMIREIPTHKEEGKEAP